MFRLITLLTILILVGCEPASEREETAEPPADTTAQAPTAGENDAGADPGVELHVLLDRAYERDQEGRLTVLERLDEPARVTTETRENRHDPSRTDTLRTWHYDALTLTVVHAGQTKEILKSITVSGDRYRTDEGLHVGMSRGQLENAWGEPSERRNGTYVYERNGPMPMRVHAAFDGDTVTRLEWVYPID